MAWKLHEIVEPVAKRRIEEALRTGGGVESRHAMTSPSLAEDSGKLTKPLFKGPLDSASPICSSGTSKVAIGSSRRCARPTRSSYSRAVVCAYFAECGIAEPVFEYHFHSTRKWRFDIAWPENRVAIEVQGGLWVRGRHVQPAALVREYQKLNSAALHGWRILYYQPHELCLQSTVAYLKLMLL